jgi:hypothetical protein
MKMIETPTESKLELMTTLEEVKGKLYCEIEVDQIIKLIFDGTYTTSEQVKTHPRT